MVCHNEELYSEVDMVYRRMTRGKDQHLAIFSPRFKSIRRKPFWSHYKEINYKGEIIVDYKEVIRWPCPNCLALTPRLEEATQT
ncbi:hypothetical protein RB195_018182 [Necator americanus]|uniref:Uncharacterized protein n=1 Tax=Necator americanus TaxID=51031 RepID=A0ABR1C8K4_NECAM